MARLETWYKQDLKKPLIVHKHADVFNQDSRGNLIGVEVYKDGEPVTLAGSISGYCLLADGTTVPAVGASRSGNKASVLIPRTAYSVPGPITITIKNVEGNDIATLCAVVGLVRQSVSGNLVNPGSVVTDWSNSINAQLQAVQTAADNVGAIVAAPFNENTVYVVGNYVTNNGNLYRITADHASGVAWADTSKVQCTVGSELSDLKSALRSNGNNRLLFTRKYIMPLNSYQVGDIVSLTPEYYSSGEYTIEECHENDEVIINTQGGNNARAYAFLDESNRLIVKAVADSLVHRTILAPHGTAKVVINNTNFQIDEGCYINGLLYFNENPWRFGKNIKSRFIKGFVINCAGNVGDVISITPTSAGNYSHILFSVNPGDIIDIEYIQGGQNPRAYCFLNDNNEIIYVSPSSYIVENSCLEVPEGATKCILNSVTNKLQNCYYAIKYYYKKYVWEYVREYHNKDNILPRFGKLIDFVMGSNINDAGNIGDIITIVPQKISDWAYAIIPVRYGDVIDIESISGGLSPRAYCFLDEDNRIIDISPTNYNAKNIYLEVPEGATKCILNSYRNKLHNCYYGEQYYYMKNVDAVIDRKLNSFHFPKYDDYVFQLKNIVDCIGQTNFYEHTLTIQEANAYVSWPVIASHGDELVCVYARGISHTDGHSGAYYKTSPDGIVWSSEKELLDTGTKRENATGKGYDTNGNILYWIRVGNDFILYRYDGNGFSVVTIVNMGTFAHVGDIIKANNDVLISFWNDYATNRSYGILKSINNGATWEKITFASESSNSEVPTETQGVYFGNGRILAIGRKDISGGTFAQMQFQSTDNGETWTKEYTNITDISASTASLIYDSSTNKIYMYYYNRGAGKLLCRVNTADSVWNNPTGWNASEVVATGGVGQDAGNANAVAYGNLNCVTYYSGNSLKTGVFDVLKQRN